MLISHVDTEHVKLPRLQIIRGRTLFKLNVWNSEFGLFVSFSQMQTLELPALRDILNGSVGMFNNYNLCHIRTIEWDEIISGETSNYTFILVEDDGDNLELSSLIERKSMKYFYRSQATMPLICTLTTSPRRNGTVRSAIRLVRKAAGAKALKTVRNLARPIVHLSVHKEDVLDQSQENVVTW